MLGTLLLSLQLYAASSPEQTYIITIADIHFDPYQYCNNKDNCPIINKLRQANVSQWPQILQNINQQMPQFKQDTNYKLLTSTLQNINAVTQNSNPKFVLVLGDFLGHDFRRKFKKFSADKSPAAYRAFAYKTFNFIALQLKQNFPNTPIYSIVGNNDSYQGNYVSDPGGSFFHEVGSLWSGISDANNRETMRQQFNAAGYYALTLQSGLRLIVLNTNLFSYNARGKNIDQAAATELDWFHQQLQTAKDNHQKIIIAMHIPPGINLYAASYLPTFTVLNLWKADYSQRYNEELKQFAPDIAAIFSGHLHADWYQTINLDTGEIPFTVTPAVSPIYGTNPGFKIYTYGDGKLTDFTTHQYPLSQKRISLIQTSFNLSQNLRCDNADVTDSVDWSAYYHCFILR